VNAGPDDRFQVLDVNPVDAFAVAGFAVNHQDAGTLG
jgi:hypothetical protein